ncbi:AraC family transcriptional regulator [Enterobacteriaceae bacterium RIT691]|nr:AraC family transcriptional regulator [Enterobacteriaceae bacterium RIT691]
MRLCSSKACVVVLTESKTKLTINNNEAIIIPEKSIILLAIEGQQIDFSQLNTRFVAHIDRETVKAYLRFIDKKLTGIAPLCRHDTPFICRPYRTPEVFKQAALHSVMQTTDICEIKRTRSLLFTVLSNFLDDVKFLPLLLKMLPPATSARVRSIINSDIQKEWCLDAVASNLFMSSSLLKKKLKNEDTSYSQIITECRMRYAAEQLVAHNKNINSIALCCGYHSPSHFISVFKSFYGITPLHYAHQFRTNTPEHLAATS